MIGLAVARSEGERPRQARRAGARKRGRVRPRKARRSSADSVYRLLFADLLVRYRSECGSPAISPSRVAQMNDDELFEEVRVAWTARERASQGAGPSHAARDAKISTRIRRRDERDSRARRRGHEGR